MSQILREKGDSAVIWLGMANKYLEHNKKDKSFVEEMDFISSGYQRSISNPL
jgi:hypothetical protein